MTRYLHKNYLACWPLPGGELHLKEAGKEVDDKDPGTFMWGEGRQVTGEKC